ncbi:antitoxin [Nocardia camponoti]|uniref:Antitoxin n=1 Tax=Nocardia camponoti TaxID=1616106 RepID=A0A917QMW0_9NOCA|nr:antitoxin [Nocardia camponoti]GGK58306.1 hypothetical protein GCM10011591_33160 [Nocardia camponoti]
MSFVDNLKGLFDKGKETVEQNADKITGAVDKAGDFIDEKTKGKYSDKIGKATEAAKKAVPTDPRSAGASGTATPPPAPKPATPPTPPNNPPTTPGSPA